MEVRRDIFPNNTNLWVSDTEDFNQKFNCPPGSTVLIPKEFEWIGINGHIDGITFITEEQSNASHINFVGAHVTNTKILANTAPGIPYGIRLSNPHAFGLGLEYSGDLELAGINVDGSYMGMHVGTDPTKKYALPYQTIKLHHNIMQNTYLEAFYIGQDQIGGPFINGDIRSNIVRNAGNDGIQCRGGYFVIEDNDVDGTGVISSVSTLDHSHGILIGGGGKDSIVRRNKLRNIAGFGVFANGFGTHLISDNDIECGISGVFTKNFEFPGEDIRKAGYQKFTIINNKIEPKNGKRIEAYFRDNGCPVEVVHYGNTGAGANYFMPGIKVSTDPGVPDPVPTPVPTPVKEVYEKFYRVVSGKRKYYTLYKDQSWELKK